MTMQSKYTFYIDHLIVLESPCHTHLFHSPVIRYNYNYPNNHALNSEGGFVYFICASNILLVCKHVEHNVQTEY